MQRSLDNGKGSLDNEEGSIDNGDGLLDNGEVSLSDIYCLFSIYIIIIYITILYNNHGE